MPTYEYECGKCGHHFDKFEPMSSSHSEKCPECGGKAERLFGAGAGIIMKGGGTSSSCSTGNCSFDSSGTTCCGLNSKCGCGD
jgi:putative FmdB family regulatory protein